MKQTRASNQAQGVRIQAIKKFLYNIVQMERRYRSNIIHDKFIIVVVNASITESTVNFTSTQVAWAVVKHPKKSNIGNGETVKILNTYSEVYFHFIEESSVSNSYVEHFTNLWFKSSPLRDLCPCRRCLIFVAMNLKKNCNLRTWVSP